MGESPAGAEVFECPTIESTRGSKGDDTEWYPATTYFQRIDGETAVVADLPIGSAELQVADPPVGLKVLLHPLRDGRLDNKTFSKAVRNCWRTFTNVGSRGQSAQLCASRFGRCILSSRVTMRVSLTRPSRRSFAGCLSTPIGPLQAHFLRLSQRMAGCYTSYDI